MTDLSRRARQVLDDARASQPKLDSRRRERVRSAVVMSVAATAAAAASGAQAAPLASWLTTTAGKLIVGVSAAIVGSGATVGVILVRRAAIAPVAVMPARTIQRVQADAPRLVQAVDEPAPPEPRPAVPATPAPIVPPIVTPSPVASALPTVTPDVRPQKSSARALVDRLTSPAPVATRPDEVEATPPVPAAPSAVPLIAGASNRAQAPEAEKPLRDELTLLRLAMTHHDSGNDVGALSSLDEYQARFPKGVMLVEAQVLRVLALCQLGRTSEAQKVLRALELATPASPAVQRLKTSCAAQ